MLPFQSRASSSAASGAHHPSLRCILSFAVIIPNQETTTASTTVHKQSTLGQRRTVFRKNWMSKNRWKRHNHCTGRDGDEDDRGTDVREARRDKLS